MDKKENINIDVKEYNGGAITRANILNKMAVTFLSQSRVSFEAMMTEGISLIADILQIGRMSIWRNFEKPDGLHTSQIYRWDKESGGTTDPTSFFTDVKYSQLAPSWESILSGGNTINGPVQTLPENEAAMLKSFGVVSLYNTPIFINNSFWGFVLFEDRREERFFDEDQTEIMQSAALLCTNTVIRAEMEQKIVNAGVFNRATLDAAPVGITIFDENMKILDANNAILNIFECDKQYYIDHFFEFAPEFQPNGDYSIEKIREVIKRTLNGENLIIELIHRTLSGELIPFEVTLTRTKYMDKYVALSYQYDLRNIKKMTEEVKKQSKLLQERLKQQELISEISRSFVSSAETQTLICEAIAKLGHYYKVSRVVIFNLDYESGIAKLMYHWSTDSKLSCREKFNARSIIKTSFPQRLYNSATVPILSCPDTMASKIGEFHDLLNDKINAFICAPLYVEGLLWGFLGVEQCFYPRQWSDNEKSFVAMTASTIAGAIMLDIYNTRLKDAVTKVTAASKAKSEFLSNMSHEMRTPMNAIINMTVIAKNSDSIERKNYALDKIEEASTHLLGVINDILDMSKIEAKKFELVPVKFNFEKMLTRVVSVNNFRIEEKHLKLNLRIDKDIPKLLICDDQRLSQIITNLLSNAIKFTPENGSVYLDAQFIREENGVCTLQISVTDTGIGISKEAQSHLFQSFQQAETSTARKYGGTGLGLSISKNFVEMMGGQIWVESETGKGSTFAFTIQAGHGEEVEEHRNIKDTINNDNNDFTDHRILLVEDMEINREIVLMLLENTNLEIDCAENGIQAVDMFIEEPERYEAIFMDVHMPGMDGYEATNQIRIYEEKLYSEQKQHKRIPIIAMTANVFKEDIEHCINAGMDDHVGKPLDFEIVMDKLRRYLKQ